MATIFAVSSGRPPAGIAVIRISGPDARAAGLALAGTLPPPRHAALRRLRSENGAVLDHALVLMFPAPATATGEDVVELHCHGGRAVVAAIEHELSQLPGLRRAEPGEFTRRALATGRIDLAEAQGLADLLAAETEAQRTAALAAVEGRLSRAVRGWMDQLGMLAAMAEAALDFADEDDVPADTGVEHDLRKSMADLGRAIGDVLTAPPVDRLRDGIRVVLSGPPNAGKSTLLNLLAERDAAIVSPTAGTTRDRIEIAVQRSGMPFLLTDTAGLANTTSDAIEAIGIERARESLATADLVIWLGDDEPPTHDAIWVQPRADLPGRESLRPGRHVLVSADDPVSVGHLWDIISRRAEKMVPRVDQLALDQTQRHWCAIAQERLQTEWTDLLIGAELLRSAHAALASLLGQNATEAMLDALFGRFCIGK